MTITEFKIPCGRNQKWEITSKEDFYEKFPKQVMLGNGLYLFIPCTDGFYLPIATISSKEDYNKLKSWGIPLLKDLLNDDN